MVRGQGGERRVCGQVVSVGFVLNSIETAVSLPASLHSILGGIQGDVIPRTYGKCRGARDTSVDNHVRIDVGHKASESVALALRLCVRTYYGAGRTRVTITAMPMKAKRAVVH